MINITFLSKYLTLNQCIINHKRYQNFNVLAEIFAQLAVRISQCAKQENCTPPCSFRAQSGPTPAGIDALLELVPVLVRLSNFAHVGFGFVEAHC